jgi:hypothetical protein
MNLMPHGVEHDKPKTVFGCAANLETLDAIRRFDSAYSFRFIH